MGIFRQKNRAKKRAKPGKKLAKPGKKRVNETEPWQNRAKPKVSPNFGSGLGIPGWEGCPSSCYCFVLGADREGRGIWKVDQIGHHMIQMIRMVSSDLPATSPRLNGAREKGAKLQLF